MLGMSSAASHPTDGFNSTDSIAVARGPRNEEHRRSTSEVWHRSGLAPPGCATCDVMESWRCMHRQTHGGAGSVPTDAKAGRTSGWPLALRRHGGVVRHDVRHRALRLRHRLGWPRLELVAEDHVDGYLTFLRPFFWRQQCCVLAVRRAALRQRP